MFVLTYLTHFPLMMALKIFLGCVEVLIKVLGFLKCFCIQDVGVVEVCSFKDC